VALCKRRGFVFQSSEVYNGFAGFYDYGPLGVELKKNIKDLWWRDVVRRRDDIVGLDSSIIASPKVSLQRCTDTFQCCLQSCWLHSMMVLLPDHTELAQHITATLHAICHYTLSTSYALLEISLSSIVHIHARKNTTCYCYCRSGRPVAT
jgi:hypothetical protein